jgi:hypothetical protein
MNLKKPNKNFFLKKSLNKNKKLGKMLFKLQNSKKFNLKLKILIHLQTIIIIFFLIIKKNPSNEYSIFIF